MKIITLMENTAKDDTIRAEHGLSLYIKTNGHTLLSDCGCTNAFIENAATLGVDLRKVDSVFLSHGHYDHSGGILPFAAMNPGAAIYMQKKALLPYYHKTETEESYIGIDPAIGNLAQLKVVNGDAVIDDELALFTNVTGRKLWPKGNLELKKKVGDDFVQDEFDHEQYLVITEKKAQDADSTCSDSSGEEDATIKVLISGCAHNGILNILEHYHNLYGSYPDAVISGFHMKKKSGYTEEDIATIKETAECLSKLPTTFYTGHCTGEEPFEMMKGIMGERLHYIHGGSVLMLE